MVDQRGQPTQGTVERCAAIQASWRQAGGIDPIDTVFYEQFKSLIRRRNSYSRMDGRGGQEKEASRACAWDD
jgi:hypothetical protein